MFVNVTCFAGQELRPISRMSASNPVLDQTDSKDPSKKKELVRRTVSAPSREEVFSDILARRSWKDMARERFQSGH